MASKVDSSGLSVISEEKSSPRKHREKKEYDSPRHKSKSAYGGGHKKKLHPLMRPSRQSTGKVVSLHAASKNNLSEFTQRIMSAKLLRVKQVQNQLTETQIQLNELINENRILKNLQKRQEGALKKYEGSHAELPQLIRAHSEEIRTLKANNKAIKAQLKESNTKLKERENELEALRDNYNKLKKLSTEKNLLEREKLQKKVDDMHDTIKEQEEKIQALSRKVLLESKNYRHHLNIEIMKHKETQKDLNSALSMITKLESQLMSKDKPLPGGKVLLKRDKTIMPTFANKSIDMQSKLNISADDNYLNDDAALKSENSDSPDYELELLNGIGSSEDTPTPTQDIFPEIQKSKKFSSASEHTTQMNSYKSDLFQMNSELSSKQSTLSKSTKLSLSKKNSRFSADFEANARAIAEKLNKDMETIEEIAQKVDNTDLKERGSQLDSLLQEVKASASKMESLGNFGNNPRLETGYVDDGDGDGDGDGDDIDDEDNGGIKPKDTDRKNVPKRKLEDDKLGALSLDKLDPDLEKDFEETQKLPSMSKTWDSIKYRIQEERMKAEEQIQALTKMTGGIECAFSGLDKLKPDEAIQQEAKKDLRFVNFTDDAYILQELEKTDRIFNKLKNDTWKQKSSTSEKKSKSNLPPKNVKPKPQQDIKSFRTESQREPKYLEEFQSECQKQNLLKALKAIDVGKDPNHSSEESDEFEKVSVKEKHSRKNGLKRVQTMSNEKSGKDLMTELFGSSHRLEKKETMNLEYGTIASEND